MKITRNKHNKHNKNRDRGRGSVSVCMFLFMWEIESVARLTTAVSGEGVARRGVCTGGPAARPTKTFLFQYFGVFVARRRVPAPFHSGGPRRRAKRLGVRVSCGDLCRRQKHRPSREARPAVLPVAPSRSYALRPLP